MHAYVSPQGPAALKGNFQTIVIEGLAEGLFSLNFIIMNSPTVGLVGWTTDRTKHKLKNEDYTRTYTAVYDYLRTLPPGWAVIIKGSVGPVEMAAIKACNLLNLPLLTVVPHWRGPMGRFNPGAGHKALEFLKANSDTFVQFNEDGTHD